MRRSLLEVISTSIYKHILILAEIHVGFNKDNQDLF